MNPLTNVKNIQKLNETELNRGVPLKNSWHQQYKDSAWVYIGGLSYDLTEGDIICVFSQYGEIVNINLIRDHKTGKSKGFAFLCYEDQRSTILAVDNLNGMKLATRTIRVDHVEQYKVPKMKEDMEPERQKLLMEGCAPQIVIPVPESPVKPPPSFLELPERTIIKKEKVDKSLKKKKKKKDKKKLKSKKKKYSSAESDSSSNEESPRKRRKSAH